MKVVVFFLYLCFHLLGGENYAHAATHDSRVSNALTSSSVKNGEVRFANNDYSNSKVISAGFELEEECFSGENLKNKDSDNFFTNKIDLTRSWYLLFSCQPVLNYYTKNFKIFAPFCGQSNPIYISQGVLRI
ncbi:hypothetical protein EKM05_14000 [Flavobacterium sp. GSP27]|uniref:hypothetical protein n=1 Tax=unclassified Flavobacterium TaxID=196869 RepID=UPI000F83BA73|nr:MULTISPECIES: hypothetical protein [unclassified Flavobacterium]RTY80871.1 hypothetical protein EKL99_14255 [Flavobacterium sp. ZB4P23]RTY87043.1 hypothetical protein EKL32_26880 [Flavobacterium sp. GSN2]RTZ04961.1 hypothetical protein EKM05_14000 [Flavobacterium sp. GSP27]